MPAIVFVNVGFESMFLLFGSGLGTLYCIACMPLKLLQKTSNFCSILRHSFVFTTFVTWNGKKCYEKSSFFLYFLPQYKCSLMAIIIL